MAARMQRQAKSRSTPVRRHLNRGITMATKKGGVYLAKLAAMISPPTNPVEAGPASKRRSIENELGFGLPDDLCEFSLKYGSGSFDTETYSHIISVINPFSSWFVKTLTGHRKRRDRITDTESHTYSFEELFPCATGNADREVYYLTKGKPNKWSLFAMLVGFEFQEFRMSVTEFLFRMFSGELESLGDAHFFRENNGRFFFRPFE